MKQLSLLILGAFLSLNALADTKISNLPAGTTIGGTEPIPAVQSAATVRTTPAALTTYTIGQISSGTITGKFSGTCDLTTFLRGDGACSLLNLASNVTGTLGVNHGGSGAVTLTGILKGTGTTAFTAASSADAIGLWTGTCSASTFLRGDGACATPGGGGTVTSVALTLPSWLSVSGSPVTSSGTLAVTAATGQTANNFVATPNGSTGAVSLRAIATGDLPTIPVAGGGTGTGSTLTGLVRGSASAMTAAEISGDASTSGSNVLTINTGAVTDTKASLANKPAVAVVAITNQTLSGLPTIDGFTVLDGSVVLDSAQTTASQNGFWVTHSGAWTRPTWYPSGGTTQAFQFITTVVRLGTTYAGTTWRITSAGAVTIDTTATTWQVVPYALNANTVAGSLPATNGGYTPPDIQIFTASGTWTKPAGTPVTTQLILIGGGGGGGGGAQVASGTAGSGGGGGGGGKFANVLLTTSSLGATETVTLGAGGTAGSAGSSGSGGVGGIGGTSTFGAWVSSFGGGGGSGGAAATTASGGGGGGSTQAGGSGSGGTPGTAGAAGGAAGAASAVSSEGGAGGAAGASSGGTGATGGRADKGGSGGGSGGGVQTTPTSSVGGAGGPNVQGLGPNGGAVNTAGSIGTVSAIYAGGTGGSGGGGSTSATAGTGGTGIRGSGGGGGGAALTSTATAAAGGAGGGGYAVVITTF